MSEWQDAGHRLVRSQGHILLQRQYISETHHLGFDREIVAEANFTEVDNLL